MAIDIFKVRDVSVRDKTGLNRTIRVRYTPQYHVENNDWGEFQVFFRIVILWKINNFFFADCLFITLRYKSSNLFELS